jgi:hypothetical protein
MNTSSIIIIIIIIIMQIIISVTPWPGRNLGKQPPFGEDSIIASLEFSSAISHRFHILDMVAVGPTIRTAAQQ